MEKDKIILAINEAIFSHDHYHAELQDLIDEAERLKSDVINARENLRAVYRELKTQAQPQPENISE